MVKAKGIKKYGAVVTINGVTCLPTFMKIHQ
jgi:hypothetical protein